MLIGSSMRRHYYLRELPLPLNRPVTHARSQARVRRNRQDWFVQDRKNSLNLVGSL